MKSERPPNDGDVWQDPLIGPPTLLAYIPEVHMDRSCPRALSGGRWLPPEAVEGVCWCPDCAEPS